MRSSSHAVPVGLVQPTTARWQYGQALTGAGWFITHHSVQYCRWPMCNRHNHIVKAGAQSDGWSILWATLCPAGDLDQHLHDCSGCQDRAIDIIAHTAGHAASQQALASTVASIQLLCGDGHQRGNGCRVCSASFTPFGLHKADGRCQRQQDMVSHQSRTHMHVRLILNGQTFVFKTF